MKRDSVRYAQMHFTDIFGVVKSITVPIGHVSDALEHGTWFDGSSINGFTRIFESDMYLKPDPDTYAVIPWMASEDGNVARFICDVYKPDNAPFEGDPRYILKRAIARAREMGFEYKTGPELEFFLFRKENGAVAPMPHDKAGYFGLTSDEAYHIREQMTEALAQFGIDVEAAHHEVAHGQHEIDFRYDQALKTADSAVTLRSVLKAIAQQNGLHATFMPKPIAGINGSGMHVHQSLFDIQTGKNVFYDESGEYSLSTMALQFIAGQLEHVRGMCAVLSPTVNSYKRLVSGYEAPVYLSWGRTNRSALLRVPRYSKGRTQATRVELRSPDPSCNIYLAFAVMLNAGLDGIERGLMPPKPIEEDVYHFDDARLAELNIATLPQTLHEALVYMRQDSMVRRALGEHTFKQYLGAKEAEWDLFRQQVTAWELKTYLENF